MITKNIYLNRESDLEIIIRKLLKSYRHIVIHKLEILNAVSLLSTNENIAIATIIDILDFFLCRYFFLPRMK